MHHIRGPIAAVVLALVSAPAAASDLADVTVMITKWLADVNKGDIQAFTAVCAPHTAVIDGFPPYAWNSCADWMAAFAANNAAIHAAPGRLAFGKSVYTEIANGHAYLVYPATFTDT
jgi:hypothetical protein